MRRGSPGRAHHWTKGVRSLSSINASSSTFTSALGGWGEGSGERRSNGRGQREVARETRGEVDDGVYGSACAAECVRGLGK